MWGNKNKIRSSKIDTLIGQSMEIHGDVKFEGGLHLDGKIVGNVVAENNGNSAFVVSDKGCVEGDISVSFAIINGEVIGNVYASEKLELSGKARITGDVHYNLLEMASGSEVNGKMVHESEKKLLEHHVVEERAVEDIDDEHAQGTEPV
ncbi:MAG: polymer-forming cytoskeletal protein [Gammaproteobacteria bacterium]|nr:polymer-forming cytoskeletal protein [Gammaproteobacteria bacterium]